MKSVGYAKYTGEIDGDRRIFEFEGAVPKNQSWATPLGGKTYAISGEHDLFNEKPVEPEEIPGYPDENDSESEGEGGRRPRRRRGKKSRKPKRGGRKSRKARMTRRRA